MGILYKPQSEALRYFYKKGSTETALLFVTAQSADKQGASVRELGGCVGNCCIYAMLCIEKQGDTFIVKAPNSAKFMSREAKQKFSFPFRKNKKRGQKTFPICPIAKRLVYKSQYSEALAES